MHIRSSYQQVRRASFKAQGLCYICGRNPRSLTTEKCDQCNAKPYNRRTYLKSQYQALKLETFNAYGGPQCVCCGERELDFLTVDHINNNGNQHRREIFNGRTAGSIYKWLKPRGFPPGFQVLCMNCNLGKRINGGICPHQKEVAVAA